MRISEETRQRVRSAARELGYTPNASARSLVSGRSGTIGLILCQPSTHLLIDIYLWQVLYGLRDVSHKYGFRVLIDTVEDAGRSQTYLQLARSKQIDGLVLLGPRSDDRSLIRLISDGFPLVLIGRLDAAPAACVQVDEERGASQAVEHLVGLGHRRIACILNGPAQYTSATARLRGFRRGMHRAELPVAEELIRCAYFSPESGYAAMQQLLRLPDPPSAVFVASDVVAFGAIAAVHEAGLQIPQQIAIVGFDDAPMSRYTSPPLTTVHLPATEQGWRAGEMLIKLINGQALTQQAVAMESHLIIRYSCGARTTARSLLESSQHP